jgi:DNA adenine methylase
MHATRSKAKNSSRKNYRHELSDADHEQLLDFLQTLSGMVVLCGYPHPLYDEKLRGWRKFERRALADGARERLECTWLNPAAEAARPFAQTDMFAEVA